MFSPFPFQRLLIASSSLIVFALAAEALSIRNYTAERHDQFSSGYPLAPVLNTNAHMAYYDFSGVGWNKNNSAQSFALISPRHFVGARHFNPGTGSTLVFRGRDGVLREYTVTGHQAPTNDAALPVDLLVGELTPAVDTCDNIAFYPVAMLGSEVNYLGRALLIYGHTARVGAGLVSSFKNFIDLIGSPTGDINETRMMAFTHLNVGGSGDDCFVQGGDSGSPSFIPIEGQLHIVGTHTAFDNTAAGIDSLDTFIPHYADQVAGFLQDDGFMLATNAQQAFRICLDISANDTSSVRLDWAGHPGRVYRVDRADVLPHFTPATAPMTAQTSEVIVTLTNVPPARFYRLNRIEAAP